MRFRFPNGFLGRNLTRSYEIRDPTNVRKRPEADVSRPSANGHLPTFGYAPIAAVKDGLSFALKRNVCFGGQRTYRMAAHPKEALLQQPFGTEVSAKYRCVAFVRVASKHDPLVSRFDR